MGHVLGNSILPLFLLLLSHVPEHMLPTSPLILVAQRGWEHKLLPRVLTGTISHGVHLLQPWLARLREQGKQGVCFR
jgi:hypothetical protein